MTLFNQLTLNHHSINVGDSINGGTSTYKIIMITELDHDHNHVQVVYFYTTRNTGQLILITIQSTQGTGIIIINNA